MTKYRITYQRTRIEETEVEVDARDMDDAISKANRELEDYKASDWEFAEDEGAGPGEMPKPEVTGVWELKPREKKTGKQ